MDSARTELAEADFTQKELKELGIDSDVVAIPPKKLYEPTPLPEKFAVAIYLNRLQNANAHDFHREELSLEVARAMPEWHKHKPCQAKNRSAGSDAICSRIYSLAENCHSSSARPMSPIVTHRRSASLNLESRQNQYTLLTNLENKTDADNISAPAIYTPPEYILIVKNFVDPPRIAPFSNAMT